jgi:hypothetical protein
VSNMSPNSASACPVNREAPEVGIPDQLNGGDPKKSRRLAYGQSDGGSEYPPRRIPNIPFMS